MTGTSFSESLNREFHRLNVLLHREVMRLRAAHLLAPGELRGLYLSDAHVDVLLSQARSEPANPAPNVESLTAEAEGLRASIRKGDSAASALPRLAQLFDLNEFECDVLLLAVAPELNLRYEVLYSYLHNDVTRKRPNCDLALRLFCTTVEERWAHKKYFTNDARLFRSGLLQWLPENVDSPASSLARAFFAPPRIVNFLLGVADKEPALAPFTRELLPSREWSDLLLPMDFLTLVRSVGKLANPEMALVFQGPDGAGKQSCVEAWCTERGNGLLVVDVEAMMAAPGELNLALLGREQGLTGVGLYFRRAEAFFESDGRVSAKARGFGRAMDCCKGPIIFGCSTACDFRALLGDRLARVLQFPALPFGLRRQLWERELANFGPANAADLDALANHFNLTGGQICAAAQAVRAGARLRDPARPLPSRGDLFAAAREQSQQQLRSLAQRIEPLYRWEDLVLPTATVQQLREIENALKFRHVVMEQWGFEQRLALGRGMKALFMGVSGTGKTMTAEIFARELGLDLYKIDLSSLVSKYIGETEKNLDRIFRAAQSSNAILFFDEADALFGKRSEVREAHDRYANIEIAYLLQKTEEYEGFVILATNLAHNMDDAFKRRMNYAVEFPFPDESQRERLWRAMFPSQTPLAEKFDIAFLARQFPLTGGNIKSAALAAAYLAAADGGRVQMQHLVQAVAREWRKLGKLPSATEFKGYYDQIKPPVES